MKRKSGRPRRWPVWLMAFVLTVGTGALNGSFEVQAQAGSLSGSDGPVVASAADISRDANDVGEERADFEVVQTEDSTDGQQESAGTDQAAVSTEENNGAASETPAESAVEVTEDVGDVSLEDVTDSGITVSTEFAADAFGTDTDPRLEIQDLSQEDAAAIAQKAAGEDVQILAAVGVDISFTADSGELQPQNGAKVSVDMKFPAALVDEDNTENVEYILIHGHNDQADLIQDAEIQDTEETPDVKFESDSFSDFVLAAVTQEAGQDEADNDADAPAAVTSEEASSAAPDHSDPAVTEESSEELSETASTEASDDIEAASVDEAAASASVSYTVNITWDKNGETEVTTPNDLYLSLTNNGGSSLSETKKVVPDTVNGNTYTWTGQPEGYNVYYTVPDGWSRSEAQTSTDDDGNVTTSYTLTWVKRASSVDGITYTFNIDDSSGTATITGMTDPESAMAVTIPETVTVGDKTYTVTAVQWPSYSSKNTIKNVTSLSFPETVTSLSGGFRNFSNLELLTIPGSVKTFTASLQYMKLTTLTFEEGVEEINCNNMVTGCSALTTVNLPEKSLKTLGDSTFSSAEALTNITLPESLRSVGDGQFSYCDSLTTMNIPDSMTEIPSNMFSQCSSLTSITGGKNVTSIGASAFSSDEMLTSLGNIDFSNVTSIGRKAFYYAGDDADSLFPNGLDLSSLTELGKNSFQGAKVRGIVDLSSLAEIPDYAFWNVWLDNVTFSENLTSIGASTFAYGGIEGNDGDLVFPDSLTSIGANAFYGDSNITSVTIPAGVTEIPEGAFGGGSGWGGNISKVLIKNAEEDISYDGSTFVGNDALYNGDGKLNTAVDNEYQDKTVVFTKASTPVTGEIWLDGSNGSDENEGTSSENAAQTFAAAEKLAEDMLTGNGDNVIVHVTGTVTVSDEQTWTSKPGITYKRGETFTGALVNVSGGTLSLSDITISGNNKTSGVTSSLIKVSSSGTLNLNSGAVLQKNKMSAYMTGGAVTASGGSTVNVNEGSLISGNSNTYVSSIDGMGGGIFASGSGTTVNVNGGTIDSNNAAGNGGGIAAVYGAAVNMNSGTVSNNSAVRGGGISLGQEMSGDSNDGHGSLTMTGGTVSGNTADWAGGGIYISSARTGSTADISGGYVTDNAVVDRNDSTWGFAGGGIYVNGGEYKGFSDGVLRLSSAVITGNTAASYGGGYAACPTSTTKIYNRSSAITGNTAAGAQDVYIKSYTVASIGPHTYGEADYLLPVTQIGGESYVWTDDSDGEVPLDRLSGPTLEGTAELKLTGTEASVSGSVKISGNSSSALGGGIASNGTVIIGAPDNETSVSFSKTWNVPEGTKLPESIQVELYKGDKYVGYITVKPDADGNWSGTFTNLPKDDDYTVKEKNNTGYIFDVSGKQTDGFTITNTSSTGFSVTKEWDDYGNQDGVRPDSVTVTLYRNGEATNQTLTLSAENNWTSEFTDLPLLDENGEKITYDVQESEVENYSTNITGSADEGFVIKNSHTPETISISGTKVWADEGNQDGVRPDEITVRLLANGEEVDEKTVTEEDGWAFIFENVPANENGEAINYTVTEDAVEGYAVNVEGDAREGFTVTNTHTPGQTSVTVTKSWKDDTTQSSSHPDSVTVKLLADGKETGKAMTLSADNNWTAAFTELDLNKDGKAITYTVSEVAVEGYTAEISGDAEKGFVITNTRKPENTPETPNTPSNNDKPANNPENATPTTPTTNTQNATPTTPTTNTQNATPTNASAQAASVRTGDNSPIALYAGLMAAAVAALVIVLVVRRRNARNQ